MLVPNVEAIKKRDLLGQREFNLFLLACTEEVR